MCVRRCLAGLTFCTCYLASYLTNKYVLSVLKFTYPTLFQGWQTLIGGLLLHVSWKLGWAEINSSSRSDVSTWLPASVLFVGIIYAGSRALSKLAIPVFLTLHNVAEVILCGHQKCFQKEKTSPAKICSALFLLAAAGCLPFNDPQFDPGGYFWAVIHLFCVVYLVFSKNGEKRSRSLCQKHCPSAAYPKKWAYKILQKAQKPNALSDIDQQYLNYTFSVVLLALASHPTGDLFSVLDFPFLYFYRFHGSCCASGLLGFFLMLSTVKLKSLMAPGQCAAWIFFAKVITAGSSVLLFDTILTSATVGCLLLGGLGEALLVFSEQKGS
uniref:Transmembrane protein 241 n=1 Tax=Ursus maritimus TaxID=29073 RepID=A0A384C3K4_URSMA